MISCCAFWAIGLTWLKKSWQCSDPHAHNNRYIKIYQIDSLCPDLSPHFSGALCSLFEEVLKCTIPATPTAAPQPCNLFIYLVNLVITIRVFCHFCVIAPFAFQCQSLNLARCGWPEFPGMQLVRQNLDCIRPILCLLRMIRGLFWRSSFNMFKLFLIGVALLCFCMFLLRPFC